MPYTKAREKFQNALHDKGQIHGMSNVLWFQQIVRALWVGRSVEISVMEKNPMSDH